MDTKPDAEKSAERRYVMRVGAAEVDVTDLPALTLGDRKRLKALGVDFTKYIRDRLDPDEESKLVLFLLRKRRAETTEEEVDELPALISGSFLQHYLRRSTEVDDPFSTRSTSSAPPTGGASATSADSPTPT